MAVIISGNGIDMGQNAISKWEVVNKREEYITFIRENK